MSRTGVLIAMVAVALVAAGCGGDEDRAPADPVEDPGLGGAVSEVDPRESSSPRVLEAPEAEPREDAVADATPVPLGDRFAWCARVQGLWDNQDAYRAETEAATVVHQAAVDSYEAAIDDLDRAEAQEASDDTFAEYRFAAGDYGKVRWRAAGLIFNDASTLRPSDWDDATLQVAIERAFEALRAGAEPETLAAFDLANEATETAARLNAAARSEADEPSQAAEAPKPDAAPFDASEAWFKAIEALHEAFEAAEDAEDAKDAAVAAAKQARAARGDAASAATAIYQAARRDGDWEALIGDFEAHMAAARSGVRAAKDFAVEAFEAVAVAEAALEAARVAAHASAAARALAEQRGATDGEQAYWDTPTKAPQARIDAQLWARVAAASADPATRHVVDAAQAVEEAAWYAARIFADVDSRAVAAFRQSLQESCR